MLDNEEEENIFKIVLVGESGVGKTSIISQFVDQIFDEELQTSTGGTFSAKTLTFNNGKSIKLEIWDTAGQEKYRALTKMFYNNALACVLVYDITRKNSFEELQNYWLHQIKESAQDDIILAIAANKSDLIDKEQVDEELARQFAKDNGALFFCTSAKDSVGINELFIGIGKKYYKWDDNIAIDNSKNQNLNDIDINSETRSRKDTLKLSKEKIEIKKDGENKKGCC